MTFSQLTRAGDWALAQADSFDVLVVGMGATGAGVALDAASRGLRVLVVDKGDVASGTSSRSSKLVHGGLRYLESLELRLVREGVLERQLLQQLAPQLVRPMEFVYPVWPDTAKRRLLRLGFTTYDAFALASRAAGPRHRRLTPDEAVEAAPALAGSGLRHAYGYHDCATDDARLVLAVVRAALAQGAVALTYCAVTGLEQENGRVVGAMLRDQLTGDVGRVRARHVVNATGTWVDTLQQLEAPGRPAVVQPSKGVHLVLPADRLPLRDTAVLLPSRQGDGRSMFAIPWGAQTVLGTTDTAYDGDLDDLSPTLRDVDYVLAAGRAVFGCELDIDDVVGAWAGVRPLLRKAGSVAMSDVSRRHTIVEGSAGLLTVTGGKLTTYRRMAKDVVDRLVRRDGRTAPCRTHQLALGGTRSAAELLEATLRKGLDADTGAALCGHLGDDALRVLDVLEHEPELATPLSPDAPHLAAEVVHAARAEGAACLEDVLSRRMRLSLRTPDAGLSAAPRAARLLARELGKDAAWADAQVAAYAGQARRERGVVPLRAGAPVV